AVLAGPENISQRPHLPKDFLSGAVDGVLVLVKLPFFSPDFKELSSFLVKHLEWYGKAFDERLVVTGKHRAPHSRYDVARQKPGVAAVAKGRLPAWNRCEPVISGLVEFRIVQPNSSQARANLIS